MIGGKKVNNKKVITGFLLLIIGVVWFLSDLGYMAPINLRIYLRAIADMWPLILIIIGTYMVTEKRRNRNLVVIIVISVWLLYVLNYTNVLDNIRNMITG